ncbi:MAG TPA: orotidine-5'-phosphate decarboxylase, partial [Candidatus Dormibacteraeota bacterium]|nr:orotidine-5'-phosphate decarboxylase [Candidatus Dormibacteraeota bacterium]
MTRSTPQPRAGVESRVRDKLIVALDTPDLDAALRHVDRLGDAILWYKVGLQLFCASGRQAVLALAEREKQIFLDLKLHDIPTTVERAILALDGLPVSLLTVHASGGPKMLSAAAAAARSLKIPLRVLGVTMLTSLDGTEIPALWNERTGLEEKVMDLARLG